MKGAMAKRQKLEALEEEQRKVNLQILSLAADSAVRKHEHFLKVMHRTTRRKH